MDKEQALATRNPKNWLRIPIVFTFTPSVLPSSRIIALKGEWYGAGLGSRSMLTISL